MGPKKNVLPQELKKNVQLINAMFDIVTEKPKDEWKRNITGNSNYCFAPNSTNIL